MPQAAGLGSLPLSLSRPALGVDPGTANTVVYVQGHGVVLAEPSVIALGPGRGDILAIGAAAKRMIGRTPSDITTIQPLRSGAIADFEIWRAMLRHFLLAVLRRGSLFRPRVVVAVPSGATAVERRAVVDAALQAGARTAHLVEEPVAAAIGAGLPIEEPTGAMVVDVGGGTTEVAVTAMGGIAARRCIRVAGDDMDAAIADSVKHRHRILIGQPTAERLKTTIGCAGPMTDGSLRVHGRDLVSGRPRAIEVAATEVAEALREPVAHILDAVQATLALTPPELAADVMGRGIVLTGGASQLRGFGQAVTERTGVPAFLAEEPLLSVAHGIGRLVDDGALLSRLRSRAEPSVR